MVDGAGSRPASSKSLKGKIKAVAHVHDQEGVVGSVDISWVNDAIHASGHQVFAGVQLIARGESE